MNLLLDIGNTRVKWALARHGSLECIGAIERAAHARWSSALPDTDIETIYVASVADDRVLKTLSEHACQRGAVLRRLVSAARSGALSNAYESPARLGVDRWMACIAAQARATGSVLVADAGTALTLDWVSADGHHGGGLIAPGVTSMRAALRSRTQLRPAPAAGAPLWLAHNTDAAIASGTMRCAVAMLDEAVVDLAPERLLLTGGEATMLAPHLAGCWEIVPHLVLEGMALDVQRRWGSQQAAERSE